MNVDLLSFENCLNSGGRRHMPGELCDRWRLHKGETTCGVTVKMRIPIPLPEFGGNKRELVGETIVDADRDIGALSPALAVGA